MEWIVAVFVIGYIWSLIDEKLNPKDTTKTTTVNHYNNTYTDNRKYKYTNKTKTSYKNTNNYHLSDKQRSVKALGSSLVSKTGYKRKAKDILVEQYGFSENTAKYAVGYRGYDDY